MKTTKSTLLCIVSASLILLLTAVPAKADKDAKAVFVPAIPQAKAPPRKVKILFIGSSFMAGSGGMQCMVPAMLEMKGWDVEIFTAMTSGGNVVKQWYWNRGEMRPRNTPISSRHLKGI